MNSPYGGEAELILKVHASELARKYIEKCGVDISEDLEGVDYALLYRCKQTGYKFWMPVELAGDEGFYQKLQNNWDNYYRTTRWEYADSKSIVNKNDTVLEVGCGKGYFLAQIENNCAKAFGLEFNSKAIQEKVCDSQVLLEDVAAHAGKNEKYDKVFSFQVLEHITDPAEFIRSCLSLLKEGGELVVSVPNNEFPEFDMMLDPFDMPPHHMGCYTSEIFSKIAGLMGCELCSVYKEPARYNPIHVTKKTQNRPAWKIFNKASSIIARLLFRYLNEPGPTIMVVLRKK